MGRNRMILVLSAALALPGCSGEVDAAPATADAVAERTPPPAAPAGRPAVVTVGATTDSARADSTGADSLQRARETDVLRETFAYTGGSRDPFVSLINTETTGPEIGNMELVGVYQDLGNPANSVVVLREKVTAKRFKLHAGDHLGRARLVRIRPRDAVFMVADFGYERQETLSLRKQEDVTP